jgi:hypothetical protein
LIDEFERSGAVFAFKAVRTSERRIGLGHVVGAVAFTMRMHHAPRWFEPKSLCPVMSVERVGDVEQALDEPSDGFIR